MKIKIDYVFDNWNTYINCIHEITHKAIIDGNEYIEINLEKM